MVLNVICHNNFAKCGKLRLAAVSYPVVRVSVRVMVRVRVRVRVRVKVRRTLLVGTRASNKALYSL